jgi:phosphatidylglycerol:prolipoprotein diacylglycerol transferase
MLQSLAAIAYPHFDPVLFRLGPLAVRWYGIAYLLGFVLAYAALIRMSRSSALRLSRDDLLDLMGWMVAGVVVGGRAGWWLFYHRAGGVEPWYEPVAIWHGGMSFHGGLIGVAVVLALWSWHRGVSFWNLTDAVALVAPIGVFLGRLANFINAELVGRPTSMPWGVVFPGDTFARHPSQLYEALLEGPVLLILLWTVWRRARPKEGRITALLLILYGLFRFFVEFTREPDPQLGFIAFGWLTMGQLLSAALAAVGFVLWITHPRLMLRRAEGAEPLSRSPRPQL